MSVTTQNSPQSSGLPEKKESPTTRALRFAGNSGGATLVWLGPGPTDAAPAAYTAGLITLALINSAAIAALWLAYTRDSLTLLKKAGFAFTATAVSISGSGATFISVSCLQNALPVMPGSCNYGFNLTLAATLLGATAAAGLALDLRRK